jgi:hypothetical protein
MSKRPSKVRTAAKAQSPSKALAARSRLAARARVQALRWHDAVVVDYGQLIASPNVERIAIGWKEVAGKVTSRRAVRIYVTTKQPEPVSATERLPKTTRVLLPIGKGLYRTVRLPTDVVWHAPAALCTAAADFFNPVLGGALLAGPEQDSGTFACMVLDAQNQRLALTAGHVIQPNVVGHVSAGQAVSQPPTVPAALPPGAMLRVGRTVDGHFGNESGLFRDFALIELEDRAGRSEPFDNVLSPTSTVLSFAIVSSLAKQLTVTKLGASSGRTRAQFVEVTPSVKLGPVTAMSVYQFNGLPETPGPPFAQKGDSGALVISDSPDTRGQIVGLLVGKEDGSEGAPRGRGYVVPFERLGNLRLA